MLLIHEFIRNWLKAGDFWDGHLLRQGAGAFRAGNYRKRFCPGGGGGVPFSLHPAGQAGEGAEQPVRGTYHRAVQGTEKSRGRRRVDTAV